MQNRDIYQRDPNQTILPNNGVTAMTDALTDDERRTLRFELEHFVCEGQYRSGLVRILDSYVSHQGQSEQPAAWISGFFGSGKSHLAKMLRFLWTDFKFPEDGASARGLARLPEEVLDLLKEISTLGRRRGGLHAAAGTLGAGAGDSVRLALLGIVFRSNGFPEGYPQARFCFWLKKNGIYDKVCASVEANGRTFLSELNDLYVSPVIANAVLSADPSFASNEKEARRALRDQFPRCTDITTDQFISALQEALALRGEMPCTVIILDEVQQYIGEDANCSYVVQEVVETCSKRFGDRLLFLATGQTALSGTPALHRLQGRFTVNVELSDHDVETVTRRVVLAKRADRINDIRVMLEANTGEIDRHLISARIGPRGEDKNTLVEDYPLLPVRRRFWEHVLRAVDRAGTAGQLRTQLRIVYDAIRHTAHEPLGTVVSADFLFDVLSATLLQSGVLLREIHEMIEKQKDGTPAGELKSRLCALVFLIRKLPREGSADIGVRATTDTLADLLVKDLAKEGTGLRSQLPGLLDELLDAGSLIKLENEYSLQTQESSEWEAEFRNRQNRIKGDLSGMSSKRSQLLGEAINNTLGSVRLLQGAAKEPRKLSLHFGAEVPPDGGHDIPVWIRDGWGADENRVVGDARVAGQNSPIIHVFVPKTDSAALVSRIAARSAAVETLDFKGIPTTAEGHEARQSMETRRDEAASHIQAIVAKVIINAKVFQGGGNERMEDVLVSKVKESAEASLTRLFPEFTEADDNRWARTIERARKGAENPLEALDYRGKTEEHPVCYTILSFIGSGKKGREVRSHFSEPPYGWPRDAIDAALIALFGAGHLRVTVNGLALGSRELDQGKISNVDFRLESATIDTRQRLELRKLFLSANIDCKPNEESAAASLFLENLNVLAQSAGGEAPLPEPPDTRHLSDLQSLAGNEQLLGILEHYDELAENFQDWDKAAQLAKTRQPGFERLQTLARYADGLDVFQDAQLQIEAIITSRRLLEPSDPVPDIAGLLTDALRNSLVQAEQRYQETYNGELQGLESAESWQRFKQEDRDKILSQAGIRKATKGATGTEQEVLESLDRLSLDDWRMHVAALPQLFADARAEADKLIEPQTRHVKLSSLTLHTPEDVKAWVQTTEQDLLKQVEKGPIVIS